MKIYPEKLAAELKKGLARVYLISGDEPLLRQEVCDQIRADARSAGFVERDLFHVEPGFDWQELHYSANSLSLFADKKLIEVRLNAAKQPEKAAKALLDLASVGEDLVVLLSLPKADATVQKSKWFKALEAVGVLVQNRFNLNRFTFPRRACPWAIDSYTCVSDSNTNTLVCLARRLLWGWC